MKLNSEGFDLLHECVKSGELAGDGERFEYGVIGEGSVNKTWLLRCPVEEAKCE